MPNVTVTPVSQISVRVGPGAPAAVQSTSQFVGASDVRQHTQAAYDTANAAYSSANTKVSKSGDTMTGNLLMTGNIIPTVANTYYLGSFANPWHTLYVGPGSINIDGIVLSNTDGGLVVTASNGTKTNLSGSANTANAAFETANAAFLAANNNTPTFAYNQANLAYTQANTAFTYAGAAFDTANSSFIRANNSLNVITGGTVAGILTISNTTPSTSNTTGALIVAGGLAVSGNVFVDGLTLTTNNFNGNLITFDAGLF